MCLRGGARRWGLPPAGVLSGSLGGCLVCAQLLSVAHVRRRGACTRQPGDRAPSSADREFIEARRRALKRFINLVARHPPFSEDVVLKLFLAFSGPVST